MARQLQSPFWLKVIATFTGCAAIGALVGVLGGALTQDVGRGLLVGCSSAPPSRCGSC